MKNYTYFKFIFFLFLQLSTVLLYCQTSTNSKDHYIWFDAVIGEGNTDLYNGTIFREQYRTEKGNHKFFLSGAYKIGDLVYNNQPYYNIHMKYDIFEDELIVKLPNQSSHLFIKLVKEKINEFSIKDYEGNLMSKNHQFISNLSFSNTNTTSSVGFYEVIHKTPSIILLKKHRKQIQEYIINSNSYNEFTNKNYFVLIYNNKFHMLNSKKDISRLFPDFKKHISAYYKTEKKQFKSDKEAFFTNLVKDITTFITKTDSK